MGRGCLTPWNRIKAATVLRSTIIFKTVFEQFAWCFKATRQVKKSTEKRIWFSDKEGNILFNKSTFGQKLLLKKTNMLKNMNVWYLVTLIWFVVVHCTTVYSADNKVITNFITLWMFLHTILLNNIWLRSSTKIAYYFIYWNCFYRITSYPVHHITRMSIETLILLVLPRSHWIVSLIIVLTGYCKELIDCEHCCLFVQSGGLLISES